MNDFERIARVIRHLDAGHEHQPALADLAEVAGLSAFHFHRLFRRWAGVTPKDFLQCLTAEFAKQRLRDSASVLDTALEAGLSGPARLHDLLVTLEGASPGEFKRKGAGLRLEWGLAESPFGLCSIAWSDRGICHLAFPEPGSAKSVPAELASDWGSAEFRRNDRAAGAQASAIFSPASAGGPALSLPKEVRLTAFVRGTAFQLKVWRALLRIPPGHLASYGRIAAAIGEPHAVRAVGSACARNQVAFLIPCHRVIRETGIVQGYRWGNARKQAILAWEASNG